MIENVKYENQGYYECQGSDEDNIPFFSQALLKVESKLFHNFYNFIIITKNYRTFYAKSHTKVSCCSALKEVTLKVVCYNCSLLQLTRFNSTVS